MSKDTRIALPIGERRLVVKLDDYSLMRAMVLSEKVAEIRKNHSIFVKYPMDEGETREKWRERVEPLLENEQMRVDGESEQDHLKRLFNVKPDAHQMALEIINAIAETFGAKPFSEQELNNANWIAVKQFIYDVLSMGDIAADDFKRPSS